MTLDNWNEVLVKDLIEAGHAVTKTGPFGTQLKASQYVESGTPVINVRNIGFGSIRPEKLEFIGPDTVERLSSHLLLEDDIVFGRKGAVERHAFIRREQRNWFQGSDCLRLRFNGNRTVLPRFVSYFLLTEEHKQWMMNQCSHGATMASLNQDIISRIPLHLPPLPTQRKIASILSAYDDLIENNTRRIAIAEEMARAIYREWFVNFRFPGHENVKLVDSPLGMIPEGWKVGELQHLVSFANGKSIKPGGEGAYVAFGSNGPIGHSHEFRYQCGIIIGRVGAYCGSVAYSPHPFWASDNTIVALSQHDDSFIPFVLYMLQDMNLNRHAGGAAQPLLTQTTLKKLQIVTPPNETIEVFCEVVSLILTETSCLEKKNHNLRTTRDLLLPKLISGKLDVEDLGIDVGMPAEALEEATA